MEEYIVRVYEDRTEWFQNGALHRIGGPAVERINGIKAWFFKGKRHRIDGPAIERLNRDKLWFLNGELHRSNGPAVEYANGHKSWWFEGREYTEEEFLKKTSPVKELTVEEISKLLGFEVKVVKG